MPRACLSFNLEEPDERRELKLALKAQDILGALWEVDNHLRNQIKHGDLDEKTNAELQRVRTLLHDSIDLDGLE